MSLGKRIQRYRKRVRRDEKGIKRAHGPYVSAAEFASNVRSGAITTETIRNLEKGIRKNITLGQLAAISNALDVSVMALLIDFEPLQPLEFSDIPEFKQLHMTNLDVIAMFAGIMPDGYEAWSDDARSGLRQRMERFTDLRVLAESLSRNKVLRDMYGRLTRNAPLDKGERNFFARKKYSLKSSLIAEGRTLREQCSLAEHQARNAFNSDEGRKLITKEFAWLPEQTEDEKRKQLRTPQPAQNPSQPAKTKEELLNELDRCIRCIETNNRTPLQSRLRILSLTAYISARECILDLNDRGELVDEQRIDRLDKAFRRLNEALQNVGGMEKLGYKVRQYAPQY